MSSSEKPLEWIGSSYKDLLALPDDVRRHFGFALSLAQVGDKHDDAKVLKGFGSGGGLGEVEGATGDEEDMVGLDHAVFGRHRRAFDQRQEIALHALTRDLAAV